MRRNLHQEICFAAQSLYGDNTSAGRCGKCFLSPLLGFRLKAAPELRPSWSEERIYSFRSASVVSQNVDILRMFTGTERYVYVW